MKYQLASLLLVAACGSSAPKATTSPVAATGGTTIAAQIETGMQLYGANCASCHGDGGQGTDKGPPVVGKDAFPLEPRSGAKRDVKFHTAADVFGTASSSRRRSMVPRPPRSSYIPGSASSIS